MYKKLLPAIFLFVLVTLSGCSPDSQKSLTTNNQITNQSTLSASTIVDEVRPIAFETKTSDVARGLPSLEFFNADFTTKYYNCNPNNIVQDDPYFRCDLGAQTKTLLQGSELTGRVFSIYQYNLMMRDDPEVLKIIQTGVSNFKILNDQSYTNQGNQIIFANNIKNREIIILTTQDITLGGNYIGSNSIIFIKIIGNQPLYHGIQIQGKYNNQDYKTSRVPPSISPEITSYNIPTKIPTYGDITLLSYHRKQIVSPTFTTLFSADGDFKTNIKYTQDEVVISYTGLQQNTSYILKGSVEDTPFEYKFNTFGPFAVTVSKNISTHPMRLIEKYNNNLDIYDNNYHLCFNQPISELSIKNALDASIGSGNYSMVLSVEDSVYTPWYASTGESTQNYCMMLYYYIDPTQNHTFELKNITSIFKETLDTTIKIPPHVISNQHKYVSLVGNMINVLPVGSKNSHTIQYNYKNMTGVTLSYQSCKFVSKDTALQNMNTPNRLETEELLGKFIVCDNTKTMDMVFDQFEWRKSKVGTIDLKKIFDNAVPPVFKIGFNGAERYFIYTNIGLIAKYSPGKLHIWATDITNGILLSGVNVKIGYLVSGDYSIEGAFFKEFTGIINKYQSFDIPTTTNYSKIGYVYATYQNDQTMILYPDNYARWSSSSGGDSLNQNDFVIEAYQVGGSQWGNLVDFRTYAYTDRALYKAEDDVYIAGWIRKPHSNDNYTGSITVSIFAPDGSSLFQQVLTGVDAFGGFKTMYHLGSTPAFGIYRIEYYTNNTSISPFYSYFNIQEYKKSNYYITSNIVKTHSGDQYMRLQPQYYRGDKVQQYNATLAYNLKGEHYGMYDRTSDSNQPRYYAKVWGEDQIINGSATATGRSGMIDIPLDIPIKFVSAIDLATTFIDQSNQEVVYKNISTKIYPSYLVGLQGWDYDRSPSGTKPYTLQGKVLEFDQDRGDVFDNYKNIKNGQIQLLLYYKDFAIIQEQGPDGEWYYADEQYLKIKEEMIQIDTEGLRKHDIDIAKPGKYFVRAIYQSGYETQKTIVSYGGNTPMYGDPSNNFKLGIFVKDKRYQVGEEMEIQIEPYVKGATVIVTVEKDGAILYHQTKVLDGNSIRLKTESSRYPNASISVVQLIGESVNSAISKNRTEPRFYIGYTDVKLDPQSMRLNYDIKITNEQGVVLDTYKPGQKVKILIDVTDSNKVPVQSRLSIGIVDKGLLDLYDEIKKPLESFYLNSNPGFSIISNLKLIYYALKVFSADGTKGGGGNGGAGGPITLHQPRKNFFDVAYRRGGVITDDRGHIELVTTLPDNLTTWIVEIIGVSKDGKMSSDRSYFKVSKDIVITPNLPQFVGYRDQMIVPFSLVAKDKNITLPIPTASVQLGNNTKTLNVKSTQSGSYEFTLDMTQFDTHDIIKNNSLTLNIVAGPEEHIIQKIPLRKEGMMNKYYSSRYSTGKSNTTITIPGGASVGISKLTFALLPLQVTENAIAYLIHYPYGCLEQTISGLYPLVIAKKMNQAGVLQTNYFSGDMATIDDNTKSMQTIVNDGVNKINESLGNDGSSFWPGGKANYELTVYVYHVVKQMQSLGYTIHLPIIKSMEDILNRNTNPYLRLYFLLNKGYTDKIDTIKVQEYIQSDSNPVFKIFAYTIFAYQGIEKPELVQDINLFLQSTQTAEIGGQYTPFIDKDILKAIFVRGLIKNNKISQAEPYIIEFHHNVDSNGVWGWSTQKNMQILNMMSDYVIQKKSSMSGTIDTTIMVDNVSYPIKLDPKNPQQTIELMIKDIKQTNLQIQTNDNFMVDYTIEYIPQDVKHIQDEMHHVRTLGLQYPKLQDIAIGDMVTATGVFYVTRKAHQVAVVYPLPANFKILNSQLLGSSSNNDVHDFYGERYNNASPHEIQFTNIGTSRDWYSCTPSHYEVRFDQLFLYYDQLEESAGCQVSFDMIKTHAGVSYQQPLRLREMYLTNVWGTKYISQ